MEDRVITNDAQNSALNETVQDFALRMRGHVRILVEDEVKGSYIHFDDHNIIVNGAKTVMAAMIAKGDSSYKISGLELGDGHVSGDILNPSAPSASDTGLGHQVPQPGAGGTTIPYTWIAVGDNYYPKSLVPGVTTAKFTFVLAKTAGNGKGTGTVAYTEAGLWAVAAPGESGATLFALETFPALIKNSSRQITFEWSIIF